MLVSLPKEKQNYFQGKIFAKPQNWGAAKGGKNNYRKNSERIIHNLRAGFQKKVENGDFWWAKPIDLDYPLSEDLCELIGAFIGDGCTDSYITKRGKSKYHLSIIGDSELDRDYHLGKLSSIVKNIFGVITKPFFRKDKRALQLNIYSKRIFRLFTERFGFPIGAKTYTVKIPDEIMKSGEGFIFATIRGIFDTDGCVFFDKRSPYKKPYPRITLQIVSGPLFLQLKNILSSYFSLYTHHSPKRGTYTLEVYGHNQLAKWMKLIGFSNKRHLNKIEEKYKPYAGIAPAVSA